MKEMDSYPADSRVCHSVRACINEVIDKIPDNAVLVESGCYKGNTTHHWIEKLLESKKNFKFYAIDNWLFENVTEKFSDNFKVFKETMGDLVEHINIIKSDSLEAIKLFDDESVDFLFLDDSHVYQHVTKQIGMWLPKLKDTSILAGDDYYSPDVSRAVADYFDKKDVHSLYNNSGFLVYNPKSCVIC